MRAQSLFTELQVSFATGVRVAVAAGAVAGLVALASCTDNTKTITAPPAPRAATTASGGFGQERILKLCVDPSSPLGVYTFVNTKLNRNVSLDGFSAALPGNGWFFNGNYYDPGDGGDGTTVPNALQGVNYTITNTGDVNNPNCVIVLDRTIGNAAYMEKLAIEFGGTCDPAVSSCGGINDSFAAATITAVSNNAGAVYDHTDCHLDNGVLVPQQANPPGTFPVWPIGGISFDDQSPSGYICDNNNNPTRGFVNFEHGATLTFSFVASSGRIAPTETTCEDYANGTAPELANVLVGYKSTNIINSVSPGVFFYYVTVTKTAGQPVGFTQDASPNNASLPLYAVNKTQAYLYTFNGSRCITVATLSLTSDGTAGSGGSSLGAGTYILGVKFSTDAPKGFSVSNASLLSSGALLATHNYEATVNGISDASTGASVDTRSK